eukprot:2254961-Amphidinium_carterae.2
MTTTRRRLRHNCLPLAMTRRLSFQSIRLARTCATLRMEILASLVRSADATLPLTRVPGETWVPLRNSPVSRKLAGKKAEQEKRPASK